MRLSLQAVALVLLLVGAVLSTATGLGNVVGTYVVHSAKGGRCAPSVRITDRGPELRHNEILFNGVPCSEGRVRLVDQQNGVGDAPMLRGEMLKPLKCAGMRFVNLQLVQPAKDVKSNVPADDNKLTYRAGTQYLALWSEDSACVFTATTFASAEKDVAPVPKPNPTKPAGPKPDAAGASNGAGNATTTGSANSNAKNATQQGVDNGASGKGKPDPTAPSLSDESASTTPSNSNPTGNANADGIGSIGDSAPTSTGARGGVRGGAPWYWLGPLLAVFAILIGLVIVFCARSHRIGMGKASPGSASAYMSESGRADYIRPASTESTRVGGGGISLDPDLVPIAVSGTGDPTPQHSGTSNAPVLYHFPAVAPAPPVAPTPPSYPHHPTGYQWVDDR